MIEDGLKKIGKTPNGQSYAFTELECDSKVSIISKNVIRTLPISIIYFFRTLTYVKSVSRIIKLPMFKVLQW